MLLDVPSAKAEKKVAEKKSVTAGCLVYNDG